MYYVAKGKYKAEANEIDAFISYAEEDKIYIIGLGKTLEKDYG